MATAGGETVAAGRAGPDTSTMSNLLGALGRAAAEVADTPLGGGPCPCVPLVSQIFSETPSTAGSAPAS